MVLPSAGSAVKWYTRGARNENAFLEKGEMKKAKEIALNLHAMGMEDRLIAKTVGVADEVIKQWVI